MLNIGPFTFQYPHLWYVLWYKWLWRIFLIPSSFSLDTVIEKLELISHFSGSLRTISKLMLTDANSAICSTTITVRVKDFNIKNNKEEKLLGTKFDSKLSNENRASSLCTMECHKLHALAQIANYMNIKKRWCIIKVFFTSQLRFYPLVWMFHRRTLNHQINDIHKTSTEVNVTKQCFAKMRRLSYNTPKKPTEQNLMKKVFGITEPIFNF